jgi:hypothetical protein
VRYEAEHDEDARVDHESESRRRHVQCVQSGPQRRAGCALRRTEENGNRGKRGRDGCWLEQAEEQAEEPMEKVKGNIVVDCRVKASAASRVLW